VSFCPHSQLPDRAVRNYLQQIKGCKDSTLSDVNACMRDADEEILQRRFVEDLLCEVLERSSWSFRGFLARWHISAKVKTRDQVLEEIL